MKLENSSLLAKSAVGRPTCLEVYWYYLLVKEIIFAGQLGPDEEDIINCEVTHLTTRRHIPEDVDHHQHRSDRLRHGTTEISFRTPDKAHKSLNCFSSFSVCSDYTVALEWHKNNSTTFNIWRMGFIGLEFCGDFEITKDSKTSKWNTDFWHIMCFEQNCPK